MLIIGNLILNLHLYFIIGFIISTALTIYYIGVDFYNESVYELSLYDIINDIGEGFCIGLSWIISIPILIITYIIKALIVIIYFIIHQKQK